MAEKLTPCRVCEEPVAKSAKRCPHCDAKNPVPVRGTLFHKFLIGCGFMLLGLMLIVFLFALFNDPDKTVVKIKPQQNARSTRQEVFLKGQAADMAKIFKKTPEISRFISNVIPCPNRDPVIACFFVTPEWHGLNAQVRKDQATNIWKAWAERCLKSGVENVDSCRIKLLSAGGDEVGGSRVLAGSMIWVAD